MQLPTKNKPLWGSLSLHQLAISWPSCRFTWREVTAWSYRVVMINPISVFLLHTGCTVVHKYISVKGYKQNKTLLSTEDDYISLVPITAGISQSEYHYTFFWMFIKVWIVYARLDGSDGSLVQLLIHYLQCNINSEQQICAFGYLPSSNHFIALKLCFTRFSNWSRLIYFLRNFIHWFWFIYFSHEHSHTFFFLTLSKLKKQKHSTLETFAFWFHLEFYLTSLISCSVYHNNTNH